MGRKPKQVTVIGRVQSWIREELKGERRGCLHEKGQAGRSSEQSRVRQPLPFRLLMSKRAIGEVGETRGPSRRSGGTDER